MNFYKHFLGDYQRDTGHLSMLEHGAYRLLLDTFYATGRPLPAEKKALYRLVRAEGPQETKAVDRILLQFWKPIPDEREEFRQQMKIDLAADRQLLWIVASDAWFAESGYVNFRAVREMLDSQRRAGINRKTAIEREAKKRLPAQQGGQQ